MSDIIVATPLLYSENFAKYHALYIGPVTTAMLTTLKWCYKGQRSMEDHLADLGAELSKKTSTTATELNRLKTLKNQNDGIKSLDITFLFKIIKYTWDLSPTNDVVWTKNCPNTRRGELEYLLLQLKNGRNDIAHAGNELKDITDQVFEGKCEEMKDLLTKLLRAAANKGNVGPDVQKMALDEIEDNIQKIKSGKNICDSISPQTFQLIVEGLRSNESSNDQLKEIKEYSAPKLKKKDDFQTLKDILQLNNSSVIVVQGEAGMGKTAMSRFLFNSWLSGNMDSVEGLSSFDVVIRVSCNQINDRDINLFYERLFPISFTFTNTNSFKKSLDEFKVFWIMDGFDESTPEFKGFLTAMTDALSEKHKLLITTRPHTYEDLKSYLGELSMTSLTLELLQDRNVEEIIQSLITEDEKKETFKTHFKTTLDEAAKHLLRTPLNLDLYIKLWMQDPELVRDTFTTKMLFLKTIYHNLSLLQERLVGPPGRTSWSSEDLKGYVNKWFYGSLCKQSFLMLMEGSENFISKEDLDTIRGDAFIYMLDPSMCLSTFLVQVKKKDWEDEEEREDEGKFRYEFHHLTQQYILASLFLKHFKDYDGENVINSNYLSIYLDDLIKFYVEMTIEDGSLDNDCTQVFYPIQYIIKSIPNIQDKSDIWFSSSVASNFNEECMKIVSTAFKDIPYLYIDCYESSFQQSLHITNSTKFLDFVLPQKVILSLLSFQLIQKEYFQPLLEFLINSKLEIEIKDFYHDFPSFESDDAFCGTIDSFLNPLRNDRKIRTEKMKTICIKVNNEYELNKIDFEKLKEYEALEQLVIWINLESFLLPIPTNIPNIPKEMVEITTIGLIGLYTENFEKVLEVLNKMKVEETLKFKALHYDFEDISEPDKRQLQKMAQKVSIDFICQCKKDVIEKVVQLNITSFAGEIQLLNTLNARHANLKAVTLSIAFKWEFYRTLKFLHDYKSNLDEVKIELYDSFPELVNTIPQELVQRTTISILS